MILYLMRGTVRYNAKIRLCDTNKKKTVNYHLEKTGFHASQKTKDLKLSLLTIQRKCLFSKQKSYIALSSAKAYQHNIHMKFTLQETSWICRLRGNWRSIVLVSHALCSYFSPYRKNSKESELFGVYSLHWRILLGNKTFWFHSDWRSSKLTCLLS